MICPHPRTRWTSSSANLDGAAWVTENSCWTCQPRRRPLLRTTEIEKQPSPSTNPDYPLLDAWPFLLIVRTGRIVTVHFHTLYDEVRQTVPPDPRGFQHIADCTRHVAVSRGSAWCTPGFYLSTVIVTAAVYRRLGSELRPASRANPSP